MYDVLLKNASLSFERCKCGVDGSPLTNFKIEITRSIVVKVDMAETRGKNINKIINLKLTFHTVNRNIIYLFMINK